jgi:hypothetical protein
MEQRWTVDTYDVPSGDMEFWAVRHGKVPHAANRNERSAVARRSRIFVRAGLVVLAAVAVGVAL